MKTLTRASTLVKAGALSLALTCAAAPAAMAQSAAADAMFRATTFNLSARGEATAAPDMATINMGVTTTAATAAAAMQANSAEMNKVMAALKKAGIAAKDIQTSGLNLNAQYAYEQNQPPKLTGYQASNQVTVIVNDLARLGQAVDAVVAAGANQVNGISFGLKDPTAAENAARRDAVRALKAKADLYSGATGYKVARLVSLTEGGGYTPTPPMPMYAMAKREAMDTPVSPGQLKISVDVSGLYEVTQ